MRELTVILSDVYGLSEAPVVAAPALEEIRRFGSMQPLPGGWRPWLAGRIGRSDVALCAPAVVAAAALDAPRITAAWLASAVHWQASLDHVRMASDALVTLSTDDARALSNDFAAEFGGSGLALHPVGCASWLLTGVADADLSNDIETYDPARVLGSDITPFLPCGPGAAALRALSAEIEMWLHAYPLNHARAAEGRPLVSALWLWGGGGGIATRLERSLPCGYGDDPYLHGLWRLSGGVLAGAASAVATPAEWNRLTKMEHCVVEFQVFRERGLFEGIAEFDAVWLAPALSALRRGELQRLLVAAGDESYELARPDLWKFWRRPRSAAGAPA